MLIISDLHFTKWCSSPSIHVPRHMYGFGLLLNTLQRNEMNAISVWTVYKRPDDYPNHYIARRFEIRSGELHHTDQVIVADTITAVRRHLEQYHLSGTVMPRGENDAPNVVETWL